MIRREFWGYVVTIGLFFSSTIFVAVSCALALVAESSRDLVFLLVQAAIGSWLAIYMAIASWNRWHRLQAARLGQRLRDRRRMRELDDKRP